MRKNYFVLFFVILSFGFSNVSFAQLTAAQIYLPGHWLEIGQNTYGAFGASTPSATYHPYPAGSYLAEVYDYGHDGWTSGAPALMGDYTYPGSPYEGWGIQANGAANLNWAFTSNGAITGTGSLAGSNTSYVNAGGKLLGYWTGTSIGGQMRISMETRIDTNASWVVVTAKLYNTSATLPLNNVYYFRGCDPDNDEAHGGSFFTNNTITYQNDLDHRVGVSGVGATYTYAYLQLCTKDCRAKSLIDPSWPIDFYATDITTIYNGTNPTGSTYALGGTSNGDYGIGLAYNIGTIAAGDSTFVSYAYTFLNTPLGIDSAFPEPTLVVNGIPKVPPAAPNATYDTFNTCGTGLTTIPVSLSNAATGDWTWSKWTWSPGTGLATTTGLNNTINISALPPTITYTITGTDAATCGARTMYLTIIACNGATVNSPCLGDPLIFNAPGDSLGATYIWYGPAPLTTTVGTTQTFSITTSVWADTGTYHVIKTVGGGHDTAVVHVTIHPQPVISGPTSVCQGSTITLLSSITGNSWYSGNTAIATVGATTGVVTGVTAGVVTIYDTSIYGCMGTYVVTVNPVAPITGVASVCMGNTTLLSNVVPGGTWISTNTGVATINTTGLVYGVAGGTSTISYTTPGGCVSTIVVTVNAIAPITGTTLVCAGGTTTLANAVAGGTWFSSNTAVATVGLTTGVVTGVAIGTSNITYTTPAGCISTTSVNVIVLTSITGTKVVCQGNTTTLYDGAGGGIWTSGNTGIATIGAASGVVTGVSGGTANITYTGGGGCYTTAVVTVNPIAPITGALGMCQNFTSLLANTIPGGTWSSSAPGVASVNSATGLVTGVTGGTATITYTAPTGCIMTVVVTIHPKPAPPVPVPPTYCQYNFASALTATPTTGLLWYGPGTTGGTSIAPTPSTSTPGVTNYYVTETSAFGCVSDSAIDPVTIKPQPALPGVRDSSYCQFSPTVWLNYQVDSASGSDLNWYTASTGGSAIGTTPKPPSNVVTYPTGTTWYVSQTVNGCESNRAPVKVTIVYKPAFTILASKTWVCDHDTLTFQYSGSIDLIDGSFQWALPPGTTIVGGSATSETIQVRFDTVYGSHFVYLTVGQLNNMCTTTDTIAITVIPLPEAHCHMNADVCLGDTVNLAISDKSPSASVFSWFIDGTPLQNSTEVNFVAANSNSGGPYSLSWNDTGIHIISINCTTNQGCRSEPTYDTIEVHSLPNAAFTFKPKTTGTLCLEDSVLFTANNVAYNCSYLWQPEHYFNNDNKPEIWGKVDGEKSIITLTVTDPYGCVARTDQEIDPSSCCTVLFPSAFTPNGDGKNDRFHPLFDGTSFHRFHSFRIVNRWGQTIFESADNTPSWDGNFNGVPQDIGVYYYFIKYDCGGKTIEQKGDCTLIR